MPESEYLTTDPETTPIPPTMTVPPPQMVQLNQPPKQCTGYPTQQSCQPSKNLRKRGSVGDYRGNHQQQSWGQKPNTYYQHLAGSQGGQQGGTKPAYSNKYKTLPTLEYCY